MDTASRMSRIAARSKPAMVLIGASIGGPRRARPVWSSQLPADLNVPLLVIIGSTESLNDNCSRFASHSYLRSVYNQLVSTPR